MLAQEPMILKIGDGVVHKLGKLNGIVEGVESFDAVKGEVLVVLLENGKRMRGIPRREFWYSDASATITRVAIARREAERAPAAAEAAPAIKLEGPISEESILGDLC